MKERARGENNLWLIDVVSKVALKEARRINRGSRVLSGETQIEGQRLEILEKVIFKH
jgi:hypothetical protein